MSNAVNTPNADRNNNIDDGSVTRTDPAVTDNTTTVDRREVVGRQKDAFGGMNLAAASSDGLPHQEPRCCWWRWSPVSAQRSD